MTMTNPSLIHIKTLRKRYHLNQKQLAEKAQVSQSLIAKIEAGKVDPSFTKAQQIFQALEELRQKEEIKAGQVMNTKMVFAKPTDSIKDLIKIIKTKGISQVPVRQQGKILGLVSESAILATIGEHPEKASSLKAAEVMEEAPPIVSAQTGLRTVVELLKNHPLILVAEKGEIKGVISKTDVLGRME